MRIKPQRGRQIARDPGPEDRDRAAVYKTKSRGKIDTCNSPHPRRDIKVKGIVRFITCDRSYGHKNQHRGRHPEGGQVWW